MKFTNYDKAIMIGLTLGNGNIDSKGRLQITHSENQRDYLEYKAKLLHSVTGGKSIKISTITKHSIYKKSDKVVSDTVRIQYRIRRQSNSFLQFRDLLYYNNKKSIKYEALELLTPVSIALWWIDKGYITKNKLKSYIFHLNTGLSKNNNILIQKHFKDKYDIKWDIDYNKNKACWILKCGVLEGRKLLNIIRDIIISKVPSMSYKVPNI